MKGRLKKADTALHRDDVDASIKHLVSHLFQTLNLDGRLPVGFNGANLVELYKLLKAKTKVDSGLDAEMSAWLGDVDEEELQEQEEPEEVDEEQEAVEPEETTDDESIPSPE